MVFGPVIDIPLVMGGFALTVAFRRRVAEAVGKSRIPPVLPFVLIAALLIVFEEDIDCMPAWCGQVVIPPTLPFLLLEVAVLGVLAVLLRVRRVFRLVLAYCVFGVAWELAVGGLKGASLIVELFFVPYVAVGYALVSLLPLEVLMGSGRPPLGAAVPAASPGEAAEVSQPHGS